MGLQKNRIAIISPNNNAYSETFIQAHKDQLKGEIYFYFGGYLPTILGNKGKLLTYSILIKNKIRRFLGLTTFDANEAAFINSLKQNRIQVVLAEYGPTGHRMVNICEALKVPLVVHFHGFDASIHKVIRDCGNYKEVFRYAKYVIVVSKVMERTLLEIGCPKEKLIYNVYGSQPEFFDVEPRFNKKQLLSIGRFTDKKAPYYTLLAFKKILKKHPETILVMAGDGLLLNTCKNLVRYLKISSNVKFLGVIRPEKYRELLTESLAFIQHSITAQNGDMEGTPLAILEASSAGLPVISTIHAGISDVIKNNKTGYLCEEHDVLSMSKNMLKILNDISLAKKMGNAGKKHIQKNYSLIRHIETLQIYLEKSILS